MVGFKRFAGLLCVLSLWAGCQSTQPPPDDGGTDTNGIDPALLGYTEPTSVSAKVTPPAGIDPAALIVPTIVADAAVGADGAVSASVISPFPNLLRVEYLDGGSVVLLGFVRAGQGGQQINTHSTAAALLFIALGGFTLPADNYAKLLDLIDASPETDTLAAVIETALTDDHAALMNSNGPVVDALLAAHTAITASTAAETTKLRGPRPQSAAVARIAQDSAGDFQILLTPDANTQQSGVQIVQNPSGSGIIAINNFRRRASVYAYLVATKDDAGEEHPVDPPRQVGDLLEVEATSRLGLIPAIGDALTGNAPWAPVQTSPLSLPREGDAAQTIYEVVVIGPAIDTEPPPIFLDPRFAGVDNEWDAKVDALWLETAIFDFVVPLIEQIGVGAAAYAPVGARAATLAEFKATLDPVLLARGLTLKLTTAADVRNLIAAILDEASKNQLFSNKIFKTIEKVVVSASGSQANLARLEGALARAKSFGAIMAAVSAAMAALDAGAVLHDLGEARKAESWDAVVIERRVRLDPSSALLSHDEPSVVFKAAVNGLPDEEFVYRWSSTAQKGNISSALGKTGDTFDTTEDEVQYIADIALLGPGRLDTVTVEVFPDDGSGTIAAGAASLGSATAVIRGPACNSPDTIVNIPYETLRTYISGVLNKPAEEITCKDMEGITEISLSGFVNYGGGAAQPLEGIQYAVNLQSFSCNFCLIQDATQFDVLKDLSELRFVDLGRTGIGKNLAALGDLINLETLLLSETNSVADLSALGGLANLKVVDISATNVASLNGLQSARKLEQLNCRADHITDISAISGATRMTALDLYSNALANIDALKDMSELVTLDLGGSGTYSNIAALAHKPNLTTLELSHSPGKIADIAPLAESTKLTFLGLNGQAIVNLAPLAGMTKLSTLQLDSNKIVNIQPLSPLTSMTSLDLSNNTGLVNIEAMSGMHGLSFIGLNDTAVADLQPLLDASLQASTSLNISCTPAEQSDTENIQKLRDRGVFIPETGSCD